MIISRTPFRLSFFGGGTDYPAWYLEHGGAVVATTIDKFCYLTCRYLPPFFEHRIRLVYSKVETCQVRDEIAHPAVRGILQYLNVDRGVEIHHDGDLPARSGMGSSSSFTVGLLHALYALKGTMPARHQLAMEAIHVEQDLLREMVGSQDQVLAAYGGFNHIIFQPNGEITVRPITLPAARIEELSAHLMLFYTGIQRTASSVAGSYAPDLGQREREMRQLGEMVTESLAILSGGGDLRAFGALLHDAWHVKRALSAKVTNSRIENIYAAAREAGAIGGKLLGAGGGGFLLLFVEPARRQAVQERLNGLLHVPFRFEYSGSQIIFFDREADYSAAESVRAAQQLDQFQELSNLPS